jgi:hypothetical protein
MKHIATVLCCLALVVLNVSSTAAQYGLEEYPSFYPHEIRLTTLDPASAALGLRKKTLHAYIGAVPRFAGDIPDYVKYVESLKTYLVVTFNPASTVLQQRQKRCAVARQLLVTFARKAQGFVFHPYPVTPYHADYLQHFDQVEAVKAALKHTTALTPATGYPMLRLRLRGRLAKTLVGSRWQVDDQSWDAMVEEIAVGDLLRTSRFSLDGWLGPPWVKEGWFQAYQLLAPAIREPAAKRAINTLYRRLIGGKYSDLTERFNLERRLVSSLTGGCERVVIGYTLRREYYNDDYSKGIENIAHDALSGLNAPVFVRTVKLKDFPWNGQLQLGMRDKPEAAWNPLGGFTDGAGRFIWSVVGDPALFPVPYNASWIPNRLGFDVRGGHDHPGGIEVPRDAVIPEVGTGELRPVPTGTRGTAKVTYRVLTSRFHDGTTGDVVDVLYPYIFAYRWGSEPGDPDYDPAIAAATALIRERLVGMRVVQIERKRRTFGDLQAIEHIPHVEIYVNYTSTDSLQMAALAPPWSSLPWHLLVLMEEAVQRGFAAFSQTEARRRGVAWLDLVRSPRLQDQLRTLIETFAQQGYRPATLRGIVTPEAARQRWMALKKFAETQGHLLVTNGPYRLLHWSQDAVVFQVFRDITYPLTLSAFVGYAYPSRALITWVKLDDERIRIEAEVEKVERVLRSYNVVREPLRRDTMQGLSVIHPVLRYVVIGSDGSVLRVGSTTWGEDGQLSIPLAQASLPPGLYTVLVTISLNENTVNPQIRAVRYEVKYPTSRKSRK